MPTFIQAVFLEFNDVFPHDLPPSLPLVHQGHQLEIKLEHNVPPVYRPLYKMSPLEFEEAKKQTQSMLKDGFIQPSDSSYGSPVLFILKKDGGIRFYIDKKIVKNRYSLPLLEEMFDNMGKT